MKFIKVLKDFKSFNTYTNIENKTLFQDTSKMFFCDFKLNYKL